jgi:hypothetical protein
MNLSTKMKNRNSAVQSLHAITRSHAAEKNELVLKLPAKNMQSKGCHLNPGFFAEYTGHLIPVPKGQWHVIPSNVQSSVFLILFIPQSKLPHACLEVFLKSICTSIILSIRTVVQATVGEDPTHICNEESSSRVVTSLEAVTHRFQVC